VQRSLVAPVDVRPVLAIESLRALQRAVLDVYVDPSLVAYAVSLAEATRDPTAVGLSDVAGLVEYGASPRGPISLVQSARALALIHGRDYVLGSDVRALAKDALRHRLVLTYRALAEQRSADAVLDAVLERVAAPPLELGRPVAA
jgi:MoxR-like ATPase